jgi:hypothetical protein
MGLHFNRTVSAALICELEQGGRFHELVTRSASMPGLADLQLRHTTGPVCHASLYIGLTSILDVYERNGLFQLRTHPTHRATGKFDPSWTAWRPGGRLEEGLAQCRRLSRPNPLLRRHRPPLV